MKIKIVLENIINVYIKIIRFFISKTFVLLILFLIVLCFLPIIPKLYLFIYNYDFSYIERNSSSYCVSDCAWVDDIKWEGKDLIVTGTYNWYYTGGGVFPPDFLHGTYKVDNNVVHLYVKEHRSQFGIVDLIKVAKASIAIKTADFKFTIKKLPRKDYKVVLNNFERWHISSNNSKEVLYQEFCKDSQCNKFGYGLERLKNPEHCLNLKEEYIEYCIYSVISKKEHISYCTNEKYFKKLDDRDTCVEKLGIRFYDIEICNKINNLSRRESCLLLANENSLLNP